MRDKLGVELFGDDPREATPSPFKNNLTWTPPITKSVRGWELSSVASTQSSLVINGILIKGPIPRVRPGPSAMLKNGKEMNPYLILKQKDQG